MLSPNALTVRCESTSNHPEFKHHGGPSQRVIDLVSKIAGIPQEISKDVIAHLARLNPNKERENETGLNPYRCDALYVSRKPDTGHFRIIWGELQDELKYRTRFFSSAVPAILSEVFGDLVDYRTTDNEPVIREFGPDTESAFVWRAQHVTCKKNVERILKSPDSSISSPPPRNATAGRMNPPGVPMFYGAMEKSTAISEIRPNVGSWLIIAKFEFMRVARILDLGALSNIAVVKSYFDPSHAREYARTQFFKWFAQEVAKTINPEDEYIDYVPTQFIAEYLANAKDLRLDGIMFSSAQAGCLGTNIVLFNHARVVEQSCTDNVTIVPEVYMVPADPNDELNRHWQIHINNAGSKDPDERNTDAISNQVRRGHKKLPTLRLVRNSVEALQVSRVSYAFEQVETLNYVDWGRVY